MNARSEFAQHWKPLVAAMTGMALGLALNHYVLSLFAPKLIAEFGWSKAQFATIGATSILVLLLVPFAGRFTDHFGPRRAALIGFISLPLGYLALSFMNGSFALFMAIILVKSVLGTLTTTLVFARVIVERFERSRGIALSLMMSSPPLIGALSVPFLAAFMDDYGWRMSFRLLALVAVIGGVVTFAMLRPRPSNDGAARQQGDRPPLTRQALATLLRAPALRLILAGMVLVNIPQIVAASQLSLILLDSGATPALATWCVSLYAGGVALGRILSGLALDRIPAHKVALPALALPAIGLCALASPFDAPVVLAGSILLIGLAQGAEGDIGAYLVSRKFALANYSLLVSLVTAAIAIGAAVGSLALAATLKLGGSYAVFLYAAAAVTWVGALLIYRTGRIA